MHGSAETAGPPLQQPAPPARPRRKRRARWLLAAALALLAAVAGGYYWYRDALDRELRDAIAEADRLDPGWRFEDIEAARPAVPDAENGARVVLAAGAKIPPKWLDPTPGDESGLVARLADVPLPQWPADADLAELRGELAKVAAALDEARKLADLPRGRYKVAWSPDLIGTLVPHVDKVRRVSRLLTLDAQRKSADGDPDGAVRMCQAALNAGRSVGDEPLWISQITRRMCALEAVVVLEGVFARGEAGARPLEELQRLLVDETAHPALLIAARDVRVGFFLPLELMRTGKFDRASYRVMPSRLGTAADTWLDAQKARAAQAAYLRYWTAFVEIVKGPPETHEERIRQLARPTATLPPLIEGLSGHTDWIKPARTFHTIQARLECAAAALAAERYRLAQGHWPDRLDALVPAYLAAVPRDPFDGQPLRLRLLPDGLVIYSVGPDRQDDGGTLDRHDPGRAGTDLGFRLWDPERRGRPPEAGLP